jgi:hypothetical protein
MADARVMFLQATADRAALAALLSFNGGENVDALEIEYSVPEPEPFAAWLIALELAFVLAVIFRHRHRRTPRTPAPVASLVSE